VKNGWNLSADAGVSFNLFFSRSIQIQIQSKNQRNEGKTKQ